MFGFSMVASRESSEESGAEDGDDEDEEDCGDMHSCCYEDSQATLCRGDVAD